MFPGQLYLVCCSSEQEASDFLYELVTPRGLVWVFCRFTDGYVSIRGFPLVSPFQFHPSGSGLVPHHRLSLVLAGL